MRYGGLIAAVVFAVIAAILVLKLAGGSTAEPAPVQAGQDMKTVTVYVAAVPIPVGTAITAEMVATQPWPEHLAMDGFVSADGKTDVVGMVARSTFQQNEPLMKAKLANPNDPNFLAGDLPKGMRVASIPLNEVDGVAGFVFPGDHVDVLFTHEVDAVIPKPIFYFSRRQDGSVTGGDIILDDDLGKKTVTDTLLTNVKVLAVDQRASNEGSTNDEGKLLIPKSASLMVSQADAQRLRLAEKTGTLSLALRSIADKESSDPLVFTTDTDVSQASNTLKNVEDGFRSVGIPRKTGGSGGDEIIIRRGQNQEVQSSGAGVPKVVSGASSSAGSSSSSAVTNAIGNPISVPSDTSNIVTPALAFP